MRKDQVSQMSQAIFRKNRRHDTPPGINFIHYVADFGTKDDLLKVLNGRNITDEERLECIELFEQRRNPGQTANQPKTQEGQQ